MHRLTSIPLTLLLSTLGLTSAGPIVSPHNHHKRQDSNNNNPILKNAYAADPHMIIFDNTYYIYPTTDGGNGQDFAVWSSPDLVNWTENNSTILQLDGQPGTGHSSWAVGSAWAPGVVEKDGTYYFYHCGNTADHKDDNVKYIAVATSSSPLGPFSETESNIMIFNNETVSTGVAIDPQPFLDPETGKYHLYWGNGDCLHAELDSEDMTSFSSSGISKYSDLTDYEEAPFVVYREGKYHMTFSISLTSKADYRVGYAVSDSGPEGPWENRGVILESDEEKGIVSTGHQAIVNVPGTDDWYIAYHRWVLDDESGEWNDGLREVCLEKLSWDGEGYLEKVTPTLEGVGAQTIGD